MINNSIALELQPDGVEREPAPTPNENEDWPAYAARALAWGQRGWNLAEQRAQAIEAALSEAQNIKD